MITSRSEAPKFQILPVEPIVVEEPRGNRISVEHRGNELLGIYGSSAYWGLRIPTAEILSKLNEILKPELPFESQGFEAIHTYPEGLNEKEAEE